MLSELANVARNGTAVAEWWWNPCNVVYYEIGWVGSVSQIRVFFLKLFCTTLQSCSHWWNGVISDTLSNFIFPRGHLCVTDQKNNVRRCRETAGPVGGSAESVAVSALQNKTNSQMAARKRSIVWSFFQAEDEKRVLCLLCMKTVLYFGHTTNMLRHLRAKHPNDFSALDKRKSTAGKSASNHNNGCVEGLDCCCLFTALYGSLSGLFLSILKLNPSINSVLVLYKVSVRSARLATTWRHHYRNLL